jgi:hypothetical protein
MSSTIMWQYSSSSMGVICLDSCQLEFGKG